MTRSGRIEGGDLNWVAVASVTGQTALRVAEELKGRSISIVCVSGPPSWDTYHGIPYPFVKGELKERLALELQYSTRRPGP